MAEFNTPPAGSVFNYLCINLYNYSKKLDNLKCDPLTNAINISKANVCIAKYTTSKTLKVI